MELEGKNDLFFNKIVSYSHRVLVSHFVKFVQQHVCINGLEAQKRVVFIVCRADNLALSVEIHRVGVSWKTSVRKLLNFLVLHGMSK